MKEKKKEVFDRVDVVSSYPRSQALEDGVLLDVSQMAEEAGFSIPVAVTAGVYGRYVDVPQQLEGMQDEQGRLWDILTMLRFAISASRDTDSLISFKVLVQNHENQPASEVMLRALCHPGDGLEPVITIMLLGED